jgi:putative tryptophan/tyrosine transport system substrate-binding protein
MSIRGMQRREFIGGLSGAVAWPFATVAQQSSGLRRIGILQGIGDDPQTIARNRPFLEKLQELGWTDGVNVKIDMRSSSAGDVDSASKYAAELVSLAPDVLVTFGSSSVAALQRITRSIPIVFANVVDPVGAGFVATLARPRGNTTGFTAFEYSLSGKLLELLKEIAPGVTRVAVLRDPTLASGIGQYAVIQAMASPSSVELSVIEMRDAGEIDRALASFAHEPNGGLIVAVSATAVKFRDQIISLATRYGLPNVYAFRYYPASGGLASYGPDPIDSYRRAAGYVDRILRGEKPADLPVQAPTKFELVINLNAAKALSLDVPQTLLARADEVIE